MILSDRMTATGNKRRKQIMLINVAINKIELMSSISHDHFKLEITFREALLSTHKIIFS